MTTIFVKIKKKWLSAEEVAAFELVDARNEGAPLPPASAGAHIEVHLPNGLIRQYSLTDCGSARSTYVIGVKLEPRSRGGSVAMHNDVKQGDVLEISLPRNNFPLEAAAEHTILIAGGIGITPLLSMARTLHADPVRKNSYSLHYFCRSTEHAAFMDDIRALRQGDKVVCGADVANTTERIDQLLRQRPPGAHLYTCGPAPMIELVVSTARRLGWPEAAIHVEYFSNVVDHGGDQPFHVRCARSSRDFPVAAGQTIVEAAALVGITIETSCEQGVCGTCLTNVVGGRPDHRDLYLNDSEKAAGKQMLLCVSRCHDHELVLDI